MEPFDTRRPARRLIYALACAASALASPARGSGPADELLKITPAHTSAALVIESLRDRTREILASPLAESLAGSATWQQILATPGAGRLRDSARQVEATFGMPIASLRDEILGEAAVFAYFSGPPGSPQDSRGLLLSRGHDRAAVERAFSAINQAQTRSGDLLRIERRLQGPIAYAGRIFRPGLQLYEFYVHLDESTFAWSNSESVIQRVIDLKLSGGRGLADLEAFGRARRGLPAKSIASLFVGPELIRRLRAEAQSPTSRIGRVVGLILGRYLDAIGFAGAGFVWDDRPSIHEHEALDVEKLAPPIRRWLAEPGPPRGSLAPAPASALAVAAVELDLSALRRSALDGISTGDLVRLEQVREVLRGLLSGLDPIDDLLPRLGPSLVAFVDGRPRVDRRPIFPIGAVLGWSEPAGLPALGPPIEIALRAILALRAIQIGDRRDSANLRVESRAVDGTKMTVLTDGRRDLVAYRVDGPRLFIGNATEPVRRPEAAVSPSALGDLWARDLDHPGTFAIIDLVRSARELANNRAPIVRRLSARTDWPIAELERDLDRLVEAAKLFRSVAFASEVRAGGSEIHRRLLLWPR